MQTKDRNCLNCGEVLKGRPDKKFCDDACRNAFNNQQNAESTNYMRNVNHLLRKNRRILMQLNPSGKAKTTKMKLLEAGFNFEYFTSIYRTKEGKEYRFCYDMGYLAIENDYYMLFVKKDWQ
jgi:predicted nucleic acid-binding Zn ribbon protein